jgi:hypothetical protein
MSAVSLPTDDRVLDLLSEQATSGLSDHDLAELESLLTQEAGAGTDPVSPDELAESAGLLALAWADPSEAVPASVRSSLVQAAERHIAETAPGLRLAGTPADRPIAEPLRANPLAMWGGWAAAAACLIIAVVASQPGGGTGSSDAPQLAQALSPAEQLAALESADPALARAGWLSIDQVPPLNASAPHRFDEGITGEIVWSEDRDEGYMKLAGIAENDPGEWVYQLWIFDKTRDAGDLTQRPVDGGVFDFANAKRDPDTGEVIVPINAKLPVGEAFLFAVTVEEPGGVVVSDRDVVFVAALG